jgi:hypothetical protein
MVILFVGPSYVDGMWGQFDLLPEAGMVCPFVQPRHSTLTHPYTTSAHPTFVHGSVGLVAAKPLSVTHARQSPPPSTILARPISPAFQVGNTAHPPIHSPPTEDMDAS